MFVDEDQRKGANRHGGSGPKRIGLTVEVKPHAYDPDRMPELFEGVLPRRVSRSPSISPSSLAPVVLAVVFIILFGLVTLGLGWALLGCSTPATVVWALAYYGLTFGSPASATIGMRVMDIEMRTWYGAPGYFVLGAVHAVAFYITVSALTPFVLLVALFNQRRRMLHDMLARHRRDQRSGAGRRACAAAELHVARPGRAQPPLTNGPSAMRILSGAAADSTGPDLTQHSRDTPQFYLTAPSPCPYLAGKEERKVFTHLVGERAARAQRPAHPWRFPPQPVDRLPAGLRILPRLRVGAGGGRGFPRHPQHAPGARPQCRHGRRDARRGADLRAVLGVPRLSRFAATTTAAWPT